MDVYSTKKRSAIMKAVRTEKTAPERVLRQELHRRGFRFGRTNRRLPGKPDIVLPKYRTAILVHGCFWHGHHCSRAKLPATNIKFWEAKISRNRKRDAVVKKQLSDKGWKVLTVWQCELSSIERRKRTVDRLEKAIRRGLFTEEHGKAVHSD